eukprot:Gb_41686 [translate_table: standard]
MPRPFIKSLYQVQYALPIRLLKLPFPIGFLICLYSWFGAYVSSPKPSANCHAAVAFTLLLRLKRHIKVVFGLSDARCQTFSASEPIKSGEALSRQSIPFTIKDLPIAVPTTIHQMLQQYQIFVGCERHHENPTYSGNFAQVMSSWLLIAISLPIG